MSERPVQRTTTPPPINSCDLLCIIVTEQFLFQTGSVTLDGKPEDLVCGTRATIPSNVRYDSSVRRPPRSVLTGT